MRCRVALILGAVGCLSLVTNRVPWLTVACLSAAATLGIRAPRRLEVWVFAVWAWWAIAYFLTGESPGVLASFDFHRRDGQIFFSLLPAVAFAWLAPPADRVGMGMAAFCALQAVVALIGAVADLAGIRAALEGFVFLRDGERDLNYCGLYLAHNAAGSVQALCCLAAATMAVFRQRTRERWVWGLLTVPLLWGVLLSGSRGSLLALAAAMGVLAVLAVRKRRLTRGAVVCSGLAVLLSAAAFGTSVRDRFAAFMHEEGTHTGRLEQWKRALREWSWSPVVGEGLGRYNDQDRQWSGVRHVYYVVTEAKVVNDAGHAHNSYVHFLAEGGLVGFGLTVGLWGWIGWNLRRSREPLRIAAFLGVLFLFLISFTEHYMGGGAMLLVLSSLVGAAWNLPDEPAPDRIAAA